jgi:O-antigen/teichoic acid export membrane protein
MSPTSQEAQWLPVVAQQSAQCSPVASRSLPLASASGVALLAVEIISGFIVTPILLTGLGAAQYGAWDILIGLVGYFGFLDLGISAGVLRFVAHSEGANEDLSFAYLATGFWGLLIIGIGGALVAGLAISGAIAWLNVDVGEVRSRNFAALAVSIAAIVALSLPQGALSAYLLGRQRNVALNLFRATLVIARAFATAYIATADISDRLLALAQWYVLLLIFETAVLLLWIIIADGSAGIKPRKFSLRLAKDLLGYGFNSTVLMLGTGSLRRSVGLVIAKVIGLAEVVHYAVANRLVEYAQSLVMAIGYPLTAHLSQVAGLGGKPTELKSAYLESTRLIQFFSFGVPVGLLWMGGPFLERWLGPEVTPHAGKILAILCVALIFQGLASNSNRVLFALAKHRNVAMFSAVSSPILIAVCVGLTYVLGVYGASLAVAMHGIANALVEMRSAASVLGLKLRHALKFTALPYVVPLIIMSALLIMLKAYSYPDTYLKIAIYSIVGGVAYVFAASLCVYRRNPIAAARLLMNR